MVTPVATASIKVVASAPKNQDGVPEVEPRLFGQLPKIMDLTVTCIDSSGAPVTGCQFKLNSHLGYDGGHDQSHDGPRPAPQFNSNDNSTGNAFLPVDAQGDVKFAPPIVSGETILDISGQDKDGNPIGVTSDSVSSIQVRAAVSHAFAPIAAPGLTVVVKSHPTGVFGTKLLNSKMTSMMAYYQQLAPRISLFPAKPLESQSVSLPWGGLFDVGPQLPDGTNGTPNWQPPHKGHKNGNEIDISINHDSNGRPLTSVDQFKIWKSFLKAGLHAHVAGERPEDPSTHWHLSAIGN